MNFKFLLFVIVIVSSSGFLLSGCADEKIPEAKREYQSLAGIPDEAWQRLSSQKIFFGHKSVGNNILDGIRDIMAEKSEVRLSIIETKDADEMAGKGVFSHYGIGQNRNPTSKLKMFSEYLAAGVGNQVDIAFMKFCYVDFSKETDVQELFSEYREMMASLKKKFPEVVFVHFTAPLVSREKGLKPFIKKILGRPVRDAEDNLVREAYNELVRKTYKGKEVVYDLAEIEYTLPDNTLAIFEKADKRIFELAPVYTNDGGHLNSLGRKIAAEQLLIKLLNVLQE